LCSKALLLGNALQVLPVLTILWLRVAVVALVVAVVLADFGLALVFQ
jgi:hypothetical protein